jgi:hypothetical protein
MLKLDTMASMNYFLNISFTMQGLKNPLVRGPGPAICGFRPNIFNPNKTHLILHYFRLRNPMLTRLKEAVNVGLKLCSKICHSDF